MSPVEPNSMPLIDLLLALLAEEEPNLTLKQRAILKMAISLLDQIDGPAWERPASSFRVQLTLEEYFALPPGRFEFHDGQPVLID
jgi:hypothetical protein